MKKIKRSAELVWVLGIITVALGVAICNKANLGVSMIAAPAFVISEALSEFRSFFSVGATEYLIQGVVLIALCLIIGRFNWRYLLAFAVAIVYGYTLDLFIWLFRDVTVDAIWMRWCMLIIGDIITGFGVACFFKSYMPLQVYELFVKELTNRFSLKLDKVKMIFDFCLLIISVVLAIVLFGDVAKFDWSTVGYSSFHSIGLGTLATTVLNAPLITLSGKLLDRIFDTDALFPKAERFFKTDKK